MKTGPIIRHVKDFIIPLITSIKAVPKEMIKELSELFIEYPHSPLIIPNASAPKEQRPGKKWNSTTLPINSIHHVLVKYALTDSEYQDFIRQAQTLLKDLEVGFVYGGNESSDWFLVRPDQFIAAAGKGLNLKDLQLFNDLF